MRRVAATDPTSICVLANFYHKGLYGLQRDRAKAMELYVREANLGLVRHIPNWVTCIMQGEI